MCKATILKVSGLGYFGCLEREDQVLLDHFENRRTDQTLFGCALQLFESNFEVQDTFVDSKILVARTLLQTRLDTKEETRIRRQKVSAQAKADEGAHPYF